MSKRACLLFFITAGFGSAVVASDCTEVQEGVYSQLPPGDGVEGMTVTNNKKIGSSTDIYCHENEALLSTAGNSAQFMLVDQFKTDLKAKSFKAVPLSY